MLLKLIPYNEIYKMINSEYLNNLNKAQKEACYAS